MIKIGNMLINPDSIDTVIKTVKGNVPDKERGYEYIQIIYKSGVVKDIPSFVLGMSYNEFVEELQKEIKLSEDKKLFRLNAMFNSYKNG